MTQNYCAFLRGVNVNGTNMKMADVISVFQEAGMTNVNSILASGNIAFSSDLYAADLRPALEKAMSVFFDYEAFLFIKSKEEIQQMVDSDPFKRDENLHNYIFITENGFEQELMSRFEKCVSGEDEKAALNRGIFYWQIPKGQSLNTEFSKILGQKSLKNKFTSRNINTIEKALRKMK